MIAQIEQMGTGFAVLSIAWAIFVLFFMISVWGDLHALRDVSPQKRFRSIGNRKGRHSGSECRSCSRCTRSSRGTTSASPSRSSRSAWKDGIPRSRACVSSKQKPNGRRLRRRRPGVTAPSPRASTRRPPCGTAEPRCAATRPRSRTGPVGANRPVPRATRTPRGSSSRP